MTNSPAGTSMGGERPRISAAWCDASAHSPRPRSPAVRAHTCPYGSSMRCISKGCQSPNLALDITKQITWPTCSVADLHARSLN